MDFKSKNILLVNTFDTGGAAKACLRLHMGLLQNELKSKVLLRKKTVSGVPHIYEFSIKPEPLGKKKEILNNIKNIIHLFNTNDKKTILPFSRPRGLEMYSFPSSAFDLTNSVLYHQADIINLHWVAGFLDWKSFFPANNVPVVWTLHDMNPFLGIEHYDEEYLGVDERGELIERNKAEYERNFEKAVLAEKQAVLKNFQKLTIVAPSKWLVNKAKSSSVFADYNIHHIPYGLDSEIFKKRDVNLCREFFEIPKEKKVILFVAHSIKNNRKGFSFLKQAFDSLMNEEIILILVGTNRNTNSLENNIIDLGPIYDDRLMSMVYSSADVLVIPSLMDNFPNTALESIMCGTPVIGFPVGGIPEIIQHGENGYITDEVSVSSLRNWIVEFFENSTKFCKETIRENSIKNFSSQTQALAYKKLFEEILRTQS